MQFLDSRVPERFWSRVQPCPISGCWLWHGATNRTGYAIQGRRAPHSKSQLVHRFTFEHAYGALPGGTELDHKCRVRACCNPLHLEPVTHRENVVRGAVKKTHCIRGHELAGDNLRPTERGVRCRACSNADSAERKRKTYQPRKRKLKAACKYGHPLRHNGQRQVCDACQRGRSRRHRNDRANPGGVAPAMG